MFFKKEVEQKEISFIVKKPIIPSLPDVTERTKLDVRYSLIDPYAKAHIYWDDQKKELFYHVEEPKLDEQERKNLRVLETGLNEIINISFLSIKTSEAVMAYLEKNLKVLIDEFNLSVSKESFLKLMYYVYRDFVGLGRIEPIMNDYYIEDIECNGSDTPLYIVHRKYGNLRSSIVFKDNTILTRFVEKLAQKCGKYISYASPLLDAKLPDGSRVNATYTQEISSRGPTFTIRKFTKEPWTPVKLIDMRTVSPEILAYLWLLIEHESNIMIIGGTGSGKTTFLNSMAFFIPPSARIVSIEDTRELNLLHENWLPSVVRETATGKSEIDLFTLLRESFRQRPDYVIVGEVRGKEAYVLFQGMNAGHPSFGTMHAENVETMIRRLESPPIELSPALVESLDAVCVMVKAKIKGKMDRRIREIAEIVRVPDVGKAELNMPFVWDPRTDRFYFKTDSKIFDKISTKRGVSKEELLREFNIRSRLLLAMYKNKIFGFKEVQEIINAYYKDPQSVLEHFKISLR